MNNLKFFPKILVTALLLLASSCTNIKEKKLLNTAINPSFLDSLSLITHTVKNVSITDAPASATPSKILALSVDVNASNFKSLQQYCGIDGTNPCQCEMVWNESNSAGGTTQIIARTKKLAVTEVQSGLVKCSAPTTFWSEIASGTTITFNIIPVTTGGNLTGLNVQSLAYKTGTSTNTNGDFRDSTLTPFVNIKHYTCHTRNRAPFEIINKTTTMTGPDNGSGSTDIQVLLGNKLCSGTSGSGDCTTPRNGFSAQNYYRNLYVRSNKVPINSQNSWYECPLVEEAIQYSSGSAATADAGKFWPLDATFALSMEPSSEWSVPVAAASALYKAGDPDTGSSDGACVNEPDPSGPNSRRLKESGIVSKCLGYAKLPKADGTCGSITDSNGRVRPMVRLRKFRTIYPTFFEADNKFKPRAFNPEADEIYVADRLVLNALGLPTGDLIYGPKPCNFAWFDHEGVTTRSNAANTVDFKSRLPKNGAIFATPAYVGTNKFYTSIYGSQMAVNPDGLILPNMDLRADFSGGLVTQQSCSTTLPLSYENMGAVEYVRLITSNSGRLNESISIEGKNFYLGEIHVRPVEAWSPDYLEDKSFQACVPLADPFLEPPMHFYADNTGGDQYMAWCTKSYPTQNPYWMEISKTRATTTSTTPATIYPGWGAKSKVDHFTSIKSTDVVISNNAAACVATQNICTKTGGPAGCTTYLGEDVPTNRCDRTVRFVANKAFKNFPLQANRTDIVDMLKNDAAHDKHYSCMYSVSSDANKVDSKVPGSGCCGYYNGSKILNSILGAANKDAHLEPYYNAAFPTVRFCGSPVE